MLRMTRKEYEELQNRLGKPQSKIPDKKEPKRKYRNSKVFVYPGGLVSSRKLETRSDLLEEYDSVQEYERYCELNLLQRAGKITNLKRQVKFILQPRTIRNGKTIREISYVADFQYERKDGKIIVEDVKGFDRKTGQFQTTKDFRLKWKMMKAQYPGFIFALHGNGNHKED